MPAGRLRRDWRPLTTPQLGREVTAPYPTETGETTMDMLNTFCGVDRDRRGVVRLTICNAGSLNILGSAVINGVREGLEALAAEPQIRVLVLAGQSEKSMIGGADIKEMAGLDQESAEAFITRLRDLCEAVRAFPAPVIARMPGWCLGGGLEVAAACDITVASPGGLDAAVEHAVNALLECGPQALRAQKALLRQWEELPLKESVDLSIGVFGRSFLTDEPRRLMQGFIDRKR